MCTLKFHFFINILYLTIRQSITMWNSVLQRNNTRHYDVYSVGIPSPLEALDLQLIQYAFFSLNEKKKK